MRKEKKEKILHLGAKGKSSKGILVAYPHPFPHAVAWRKSSNHTHSESQRRSRQLWGLGNSGPSPLQLARPFSEDLCESGLASWGIMWGLVTFWYYTLGQVDDSWE